MAVGWSSQNQSALNTDVEYNATLYRIRGLPTARSTTLTSHRGPIWVCLLRNFEKEIGQLMRV